MKQTNQINAKLFLIKKKKSVVNGYREQYLVVSDISKSVYPHVLLAITFSNISLTKFKIKFYSVVNLYMLQRFIKPLG